MKAMEKIDKSVRLQYSTKVAEDFPDDLSFAGREFHKKFAMRYGENPGYPAAFYAESGASGPNMATMRVLQEGTKGLSYINVGDMDLGQRLVRKLTAIYPGRAACALIKHEMPSGVALAETPEAAFEKAWRSDPLSSFGSVDVFNAPVTASLSGLLIESARNIEVVYAPDYSPEALAILATRKSLRVVQMGGRADEPALDNGWEFKRVFGGVLVQKRFDSKVKGPGDVDAVSARKPSTEEVEAAVFNWTVACFTRSNAIVIGRMDKVHGIGSGQRSRIDAADCAIRFSRRGYGPEGCVLASDAFMPFPDVVELAAQNGITALIYPLGSVRDQEVIDRANELGLAMIITRRPGETDSERSFLHR
jgi:phosphoribosylaminoimidazolecarboxamide formyltransferase/IMP cyclohydrolase